MKTRIGYSAEPIRTLRLNRKADRRLVTNALFTNAGEGNTVARYLIDQEWSEDRLRTPQELMQELAFNVNEARNVVGLLIRDAQTHELSLLARRRTESLIGEIAVANPVHLYPGS